MEKLEGYNSRIQRLSELVARLEDGELSIDELSEMETITRELHERSIILRYNAFKEKLLGVVEEEEEGVEVEVIIEELDEDEVPESEEENTSEEENETPAAEPMIDFSIFDEPEASVEEQKPEKVVEPTPVVETPEPEPVIEEVVPEPTPEPVVETKVEEPVVDEPVVEVKSDNASAQSFLDRLQVEDNSVASRFSAGKLDTLIGAFGLNQRLRYINDLFDGSSEIFSDAIKALDNQSSLNDANQKAAELASVHEWDPEEEVVIEFMTFLNRRYA